MRAEAAKEGSDLFILFLTLSRTFTRLPPAATCLPARLGSCTPLCARAAVSVKVCQRVKAAAAADAGLYSWKLAVAAFRGASGLFFVLQESDELERFYRHIGLFSVSASLSGLLFSRSSLSLPRDRLSFGGKWKHKQAESALWFLLLLLNPPVPLLPDFLFTLSLLLSLFLYIVTFLLSSPLLSSFSEASRTRVTVTCANTAPKWQMVRIAPPPCRKLSSINTGL